MERKKTLEMEFFVWKDWDQPDTAQLAFYDVEFVKDFGSFKAGERYDCVTLDYEHGIACAYAESGGILHEVLFTLTPTYINK